LALTRGAVLYREERWPARRRRVQRLLGVTFVTCTGAS